MQVIGVMAAVQGAARFRKDIQSMGRDVQDFGENVKDAGKESSTGAVAMLGLASGVGIATAALAAATVAATAMVAAYSFSIDKAIEAEDAQMQFAFALKAAGEGAAITADEGMALARSMMQVTKFDDEAVLSAEALLLPFRNIGRDIFPDVIRLSGDLATRMKTDLPSAALTLAKALEAPGQGLRALKDAGIVLTASQRKMITDMTESGRVIEAQGILLQALKERIGGAAEAAGKTLSGQLKIMENALSEVGEALGMKLLPQMSDFIKITGPKFINIAESIGRILGSPIFLAGFIIAADQIGKFVSSVDEAFKALEKLGRFSGIQWGKGLFGIGLGPVFENMPPKIDRNTDAIAALGRAYTVSEGDASDFGDMQDELNAKIGTDSVKALEAAQQAAEDYKTSMQKMYSGLLSAQANYAMQLGQLGPAPTGAGGMGEAQQQSNQELLDAQSSYNEKAAALEQERADKIAWVRTGAWNRSTEDEAANEAWWNQQYDTEKATLDASLTEQNAVIAAKLQERKATVSAAQSAEQTAYQKNLDDLRLKATLGVMESQGVLNLFTQGATASATEAFDMIKTGVITVSDDMALYLGQVFGYLNTETANNAISAASNLDLINQALNPQGAEGSGGVIPGFLAVNTNIANSTAFGFPQFGAAAVTALQGTTTETDIANTAVANLGAKVTTTSTTFVTGFGTAKTAVDKVTEAAKELIKKLDEVRLMALAAAAAIASMGSGNYGPPTGQSYDPFGENYVPPPVQERHQYGANFIVPPGYSNDRYPLGYASSGEHVVVIPRERVHAPMAMRQINVNMGTVNINNGWDEAIFEARVLQVVAGAM